MALSLPSTADLMHTLSFLNGDVPYPGEEKPPFLFHTNVGAAQENPQWHASHRARSEEKGCPIRRERRLCDVLAEVRQHHRRYCPRHDRAGVADDQQKERPGRTTVHSLGQARMRRVDVPQQPTDPGEPSAPWTQTLTATELMTPRCSSGFSMTQAPVGNAKAKPPPRKYCPHRRMLTD